MRSQKRYIKSLWPDAVDLGLSALWAPCNIGATSPEESGYYFAWGETKTKKKYGWGNYAHGDGNKFSKYSMTEELQLDADDDAATVVMGEGSRLPSSVEVRELVKRCMWEWTEENGVKGYKVSGITGNSIFLPAAGYMSDDKLQEKGEKGAYWTCHVSPTDRLAMMLNFKQKEISYLDGCYKFFGNTLRPVFPLDHFDIFSRMWLTMRFDWFDRKKPGTDNQ